MSRIAWLLTVLAGILIVVLWFFLVWSPTSDEIDAVRADTDTTLAQAAEQRQRAEQLRRVRDGAPEAAADLAFAEVLMPTDPALPALLRQIQTASDDSGARLVAVTPSRPAAVADAPAGLAVIQVGISLEGSYFQLVDVLRRLEDPAIGGRGVRWQSGAITVSEYPVLTMQVSGEVFSRLPQPPAEVPEEIEDDADPEDPDAELDLEDGEGEDDE